jgi:hypothetical protein
MSDDAQIQPEGPHPVSEANLRERYDKIYLAMLVRDSTARRLQNEIGRHEEAIRKHTHLRHVAGVALRAHTKLIKRQAEEALREEVGTRILPGFKTPTENNVQFLTRMKRRLREIEEEAKRQLDP